AGIRAWRLGCGGLGAGKLGAHQGTAEGEGAVLERLTSRDNHDHPPWFVGTGCRPRASPGSPGAAQRNLGEVYFTLSDPPSARKIAARLAQLIVTSMTKTAVPSGRAAMSGLGQKQTCASQKAMSALHPIATTKADTRKRSCPLYPQERTCAVQQPMSAKGHKRTCALFDDLIRAGEHRRRHCEAECLGGFEIDRQHELGRG